MPTSRDASVEWGAGGGQPLSSGAFGLWGCSDMKHATGTNPPLLGDAPFPATQGFASEALLIPCGRLSEIPRMHNTPVCVT